MKLFLLFCPLLLLLSSQVISGGEHGKCQFGVAASKESAKAVSEFALKLYKKITAATPEANTVFSPVSIALALALLESGASGNTQKELHTHLRPTGSSEPDVSGLYQSLQRQLQIKGEKEKLSIANGFFHAENLTLKQDYLTQVTKCFDTELKKAPFSSNLEEARKQVNKWVSDKTEQKIPELFKPGSLDKQAIAILANAIYMKAAWRNRFMEKEQLPFYRMGKSDKTQKVSFMTRQGSYNHHSDSTMDVVEIPYDGKLSMYIVLPKQRDGIQAVENALTGEKLRSLFTSTTSKTVSLKMPKFGARNSVKLNDMLQQLGLSNMFTSGANFSRMSEQPLRVSKALHEAYIKVNENGTEAAAATAIEMVPEAAPAPPVDFIADHPFMFVIVHKPTGAVAFLGKINFVEEIQ